MGNKQYIVKFAGLPVGTHEFEFSVNGKFFEEFNESEITEANLRVDLVLTKQNHLMQMQFEINGTVNLSCDRCLKFYDFPIDSSESLVIKYGNPDDSTDEIMTINEGDAHADISHYLYEYIILALPSRRVPCEIEESFICDEDTLKTLNKNLINKEVNPIWEKLNKLKINKN